MTAAEVERRLRRRNISIGTERKDLISRSTNILMLLHCPEVTDNHLPGRIILRIITMFKIGAENLQRKIIVVKIGTWCLLKEKALHQSASVKNVLDAVSFYWWFHFYQLPPWILCYHHWYLSKIHQEKVTLKVQNHVGHIGKYYLLKQK